MLTAREADYLKGRPLKRLTFDGVNDLYLHPLYGARTIANIIEMDSLRPAPEASLPPIIPVSDEMMLRHERCVEQYGCGLC